MEAATSESKEIMVKTKFGNIHDDQILKKFSSIKNVQIQKF